MLSSFRATFFLICLFLSLTTVAQTTDLDPTIQKLITEISIKEQITEITSDVRDQIKSNPLNLSEQNITKMISRFDNTFTTDFLMQQIRQTFNKQEKQAFTAAISKWLADPSTQKILDEKARFYSLQGLRERIVRQYEMEQNPLPQSNKDLIEALVKAISTKESVAESQTIIFKSILSAFNVLSKRNFGDAQIEGIIQNYRLQIQPQVDRDVINRNSIMYYHIDDESLQNYLTFYESKAGQWLSSTTAEAIHSALQSAADRFNQSIREASK